MRCAYYKVFAIALSAFMLFSGRVFAQAGSEFTGEVNADKINIRTDSTIGSQVICSIDKGRRVQVVSELYDWYKIRLPKSAPSYIKKNFVTLAEEKLFEAVDKFRTMDFQPGIAGKVSADRVNIRLSPGESSAILGKAGKDEAITIVREESGWYKIEPIHNSYGWINKKFVNKAAVTDKTAEEVKPSTQASVPEKVTLEGIIKPYGVFFRRVTTHRLIAADNNVFLLKGDKKSLDAFNNQKAKVTGKLISEEAGKLPAIEVEKIERVE